MVNYEHNEQGQQDINHHLDINRISVARKGSVIQVLLLELNVCLITEGYYAKPNAICSREK